jgi:hypothetical protein
MLNFARQSILGFDVIVTPDRPKRVLAADVPVTLEFRAETDAWMLGFFGTTNLMEDAQVIRNGQQLFMNPRTLEMMRREVAQ